jgi:prophage antirepressor-like protein
MTQAVQCFGFEDHLLRVLDKEGSPWFFAKDPCNILGIKNTRDAVEKLDNDEKGVALTDTLGGEQEVLIVSESGLYTLILRSRAATTPGSPAHRFRKWVTAEVLPAIRRSGSYSTAPATEGESLPASVAEDRIKLDKLHYALRCFGPAVARDLWFDLGLPFVPSMAGAKAKSQPVEMTVSNFTEERLQRRPGVITAAGVIYAAYRDWCGENGIYPLGDSQFGRALVRLGFDKVKSNRIYYRNIVVKPAEATGEA